MTDYPNLGFDPAPGNVNAVEVVAAALQRVTRECSGTHGDLTAIGQSNGIWVGRSADTFAESFDELPPYLDNAVTSMDAAARAIDSWAARLSEFQTRARQLEDEAATAAQELSTAQTGLDELPTDTSGMSDAERSDHEDATQRAQDRVDSAASTLEDVRSRANTLNGEFTAAAAETAGSLRSAADDAPPEPGFWDNVGDFFSGVIEFITDPEVWKLIGDLLADLAMIVGVAALVIVLFFSGPLGWMLGGLAWAGFGLAAGAFIFHGAAMLGGAEGVTWETLAFDAIGVVAGAVGIGGMAIARAGQTTLNAGRSIRAAGGFANFFRSIPPRLKGWSLVVTGSFLDFLGLSSSNAGAMVSEYRGVSDGLDFGDIPVIGPIGRMFEWRPDGTGAFVPSESLASAGQAFSGALRGPSSPGAPAWA